MAFYLDNYPRVIQHQEVNVITYVIESWLAEELNSVESFVQETLDKNFVVPEKCLYAIVFAWRLKEKRMLDLWIFTGNHIHDLSGPLISVCLFSEFKPDKTSKEIASGNTIFVLGLEEDHRRNSNDLRAYFKTRPGLPEFLCLV